MSQKPWKYKQFWGLRPDPRWLEKKISVRNIEAELLEIVCKYRANRNGVQ